MKEHGAVINARMGLKTRAAFTGTQEDAVISGDVAMLDNEVTSVLQVLRKNGSTLSRFIILLILKPAGVLAKDSRWPPDFSNSPPTGWFVSRVGQTSKLGAIIAQHRPGTTPFQHGQLLSQHEVFEDEIPAATDESKEGPERKSEHTEHRPIYRRVLASGPLLCY